MDDVDSRGQFATVPPRDSHNDQGRISIIDTASDAPETSTIMNSPVHSIRPRIHRVERSGQYSEDSGTSYNSTSIARTDILMPEHGTELRCPKDEALDPQQTPRASDFRLSADHSGNLPRQPLLNEPVSFLSTTTSSHQSSDSLSPAFEDEKLIGVPEPVRQESTSRIPTLHHTPSVGNSRLLSSRPKAARMLGTELQALATEQGGIPISALSSPVYSQPSASSAPAAMPHLRLSAVLEERTRPNSPWKIGYPHPQPLSAHPTGSAANILHRSATMPARKTKRPTFLPISANEPKSSTSFTRESVLSTPYPGSGFNIQRTITVRSQPGNASVEDTSHQFQTASTHKIPLILRNSRYYTSGIGKVDLTCKSSKQAEDVFTDDKSLACSIIREYRRLRGIRSYLSAKSMVGIRVVLRSRSRNHHVPSAHEISNWQGPPFHSSHEAAEEGNGGGYSTAQKVMLRDSEKQVSKRRLEEALTFLLNKPATGSDSQTCSNDLRRLVSEATHPRGADKSRSTVTLELIEGWNFLRISFTICCVVLTSIIVMLIWILIGVDGTQAIDSGSHGIVRAIPSTVGDSILIHAGWNGAGSRVTGGATLGILTFLLGWSWIGLWMGMSWIL